MKHEWRMGIVGLYAACLLLLGAAGCGNQADSGKPTPQALQAFEGDPSKMPADVKAKYAAEESAGVQNALQPRTTAASTKQNTQ